MYASFQFWFFFLLRLPSLVIPLSLLRMHSSILLHDLAPYLGIVTFTSIHVILNLPIYGA